MYGKIELDYFSVREAFMSASKDGLSGLLRCVT